MEKVKTAWDIKREHPSRGRGCLPAEALNDWARDQIYLSKGYSDGRRGGSSSTEEGRIRKAKMLERMKEALTTRSNLGSVEIARRLAEVEAHLEDPGLLQNFEYFDVPSSDFMIQFYFAVWDRRIAEVMDYLHNYGKDLKGVARKVPTDDIWYQMSYFEGMNIDKREQAKDLVDFIKAHHITKATSFGGGNIPERLYGLPKDLQLTVFDNGPVSSLEELFPDASERQRINYIHEPFANAPYHPELLNTQELVWMYGLSMYLDENKYEMTGAIQCAASILRPNGYMRYDYLVMTDSMERVVITQNWPNDPRRPMTTFSSPEAAIRAGEETLRCVNVRLNNKAFMDTSNICVRYLEPWGVTNVTFIVQKHV